MKVENLVPELRFCAFTDKWTKTKLEDISVIASGGTPNRASLNFWNGTIPWVTTSLVNYTDIIKSEEYITELGVKNSSAKLFPIGTILMAMYGQGKTRGQVAKLGIEATTNQACAAIMLNDTVNEDFVYQKLVYAYNELRDLSNSGGQKNLSIGLIKKFHITFPSLPEQQKIAAFLTSIDKRIQLLQTKKEKLEEYKKGIMQKIFSQEIRFKDENGNPFPDWEEKKLGDVGATFNGLTGKTKVDFGEGKPYIQYTQIFKDSVIKDSECGLVKIDVGEKQSKAQYGDVFFTTSSETPHEIGTASVLTTKIDELYLNSFSFGFRPFSLKDLSPNFSRFFFRSPKVRKEIIKLAQGSTRFNMSKVAFLKLVFMIPTSKEQVKIANFLSSIDDGIDKVNQQIEGSKEFKKGLLQKMFV